MAASSANQTSDSTRKLQKLGKVGQILCILTIVLRLLIVFVSEVSVKISNILAPIIPEFEIRQPGAISVASWKEFLASALPYCQELYFVLGILLCMMVFRRFAHGEILTRGVATNTKLFGLFVTSCCLQFYYSYEKVITDQDVAQRTTSFTVSEKFFCSFDPQYILAGLFIIALGFAISFAVGIQEENNLTI